MADFKELLQALSRVLEGSNSDNPFTPKKQPLLGTDTPMTKREVDEVIREAYSGPQYPCVVCGQPSRYQLIAKQLQLNTTELAKEGFVCQFHVDSKVFDPSQFGLRPL